ncbi:MAG: Mrp/NBP35 family ATP-binding protein [Leptolinea sp.]|nr:Mrp/NBP35 family ATP-binding protein [Leptolinea sp.]
MASITKEIVMTALGTVQDPELHKDLVTLNMIKDVTVDGSDVSFTVELTTPACPLRNQIQSEAKAAVENIPGVKNVSVNMSARVLDDGRDRGIQGLSIRNAIAVASGKGGVGKSTISVNLAIALAKAGAKVGLLDADIYGPNVPTMMGVDHLPPALGEKMIPAEVYGVKLMSIGFLVKPGQPLIWRGPMLHSAIRQFLSDVEWGDLDYLVIDLPPGTGDAQLSLAQSIPLSGAVIVTLPQAVSLEDASRGLQMFKVLNVPIIGVVENMSYLELPDGTRMDVFGSGGGQTLAKDSEVPFLGSVPMDPDVRKGSDSGSPIVHALPDSPSAKAMTDIAEKVAASLSVAAASKDKGVTIKMVG